MNLYLKMCSSSFFYITSNFILQYLSSSMQDLNFLLSFNHFSHKLFTPTLCPCKARCPPPTLGWKLLFLTLGLTNADRNCINLLTVFCCWLYLRSLRVNTSPHKASLSFFITSNLPSISSCSCLSFNCPTSVKNLSNLITAQAGQELLLHASRAFC